MRRRAEVHKQIGTVTKVLVLTIDGADSDPTRDATAGLDEERSSPVVCGYRTTHKGVTMNTSRTPRVGYTMFNVLLYVAEHPSCTQQAAAIYAGPNGSQGYGARSVQRCLTAGLIEDDRSRGKRGYSLRLTEAGAAVPGVLPR